MSPPDEAPSDPFGYDRPVTGCFEGRVYLIGSDTFHLPPDWRKLPFVQALWACELNVERHIRDHGFARAPDRTEWFAVRYLGAFHVADPGVYFFRMSSDDGARLTIDGQVVVSDDSRHAARDSDGEIELAAGDHTLAVEYFQGGVEVNLQVWVAPPGGREGLLSVR